MLEPLKRYDINPKTCSRTAMLSNYILCPPVIHRPLQTLLRTHLFVGDRLILSFWWISPTHRTDIRGHSADSLLGIYIAPILHLISTLPGRILFNLCGLILNVMVPSPLLYCFQRTYRSERQSQYSSRWSSCCTPRNARSSYYGERCQTKRRVDPK